jgi:hypothetical protein
MRSTWERSGVLCLGVLGYLSLGLVDTGIRLKEKFQYRHCFGWIRPTPGFPLSSVLQDIGWEAGELQDVMLLGSEDKESGLLYPARRAR